MLRTGLLGFGGIGRHLARELADHPDAALTAVVDVNPDNLEVATDEFDVADDACYTDEERMYEETALDAVVIATPPAFHYRQIHRAFDRGLHVLCEKPVVVDLEEARDVAATFEGGSQVLMACYQRHLDPAFVEGYERWHDGGTEPTFITGELTQNWLHHFESGANWRTDPDVGGRGHLFSVGTHVLEAILWMIGLEPESVSAEMTFYDDSELIDQQSSLSIRFANGAVASVADSAVVATERESIRVWDDDGALQLTSRNWEPPALTLIDADGTESIPDVDRDRARGKVEAFVDAVETGAEPPATIGDVVRVTAVLDAAYESARTGERIPVDID